MELLVVLAIVALLIALTVPGVQRARDTAARADCAAQVRQLALAVHQYADARRKLPEGCGYPYYQGPQTVHYHAPLSWHTSLLPYVDQGALWSLAAAAYRASPSSLTPQHAFLATHTIPVFQCPADARQLGNNPGNGSFWGLSSYKGVAGTARRMNDGLFHTHLTVRFADITDGTSNTVMIGERPPGPDGNFGAWCAGEGSRVCEYAQILDTGNTWLPSWGPHCLYTDGALRPGSIDNICDVTHFWSLHSGGANFAFADGSVRFLRYDASALLPALSTRAGGEIVTLD